MKLYFLFIGLIVFSCSDRPNTSGFFGTSKISKAQVFLSDLRDSLQSQYHAVGSAKEKRHILEQYHQKLLGFLMRTPLDSMRVTIDKVATKGMTVTTSCHINGIEFNYGLTFNGPLSPRADSIYKFMKSLKEGSDTLANFSFTGACQVNDPDSPGLSTFRIYAFPVPVQYTGE